MNIISRKDAKAQGLKRYYTGKPCKQGHMSERGLGNGECGECARLRALKLDGAIDTRKRNERKTHPDFITVSEARTRGLSRYFTGIPCIRGHICERILDGTCIECRRDQARIRSKTNEKEISKRKLRQKKRYLNVRHVEKFKAYKREWMRKQRAKLKISNNQGDQ